MNGGKTPFIVLIIILIISAVITDFLHWPLWAMAVMFGVLMIAYLFWPRK